MAIVLRLPAFSDNFVQTDEALYSICAEKILNGKALYGQIWYSGQPLMVWFYTLFVGIFGSAWLWAIRIFTILYVYITALYFGGWLGQYRPFEKYPLLPPVILILLCSSPWYTLELNAELLMLLPFMLIYETIIQLSEQRVYSYQPYFLAGILAMLCLLASFQFFIPFVSVFILYLVLKRAAIDELTAILGGGVVALTICLVILYFTDSLAGYWDMTLLYGFDWLRYEMFNDSFHNIRNSLLGFFAVEAIFAILAILGFVRFRVKYFTSLIKIRRLELGMAIWLGAGVSAIFLSVARTELHEWILIAPPLAFYATKAFDMPLPKKWLYPLILIVSFLPALFIFLSFWTQKGEDPKNKKKASKSIAQNEALKTYFKDKKIRNGIWIMEYQPEAYLALDKPCATKYVDYRIVYQKFHPLPYASTHLLVSKVESDAAIFEEFQHDKPDYILDKEDLFPKIQEMYPVLFYNYIPESVGGYKVYHP